MSDLDRQPLQRIADITSDLSFEQDFGHKPIALGHVCNDQAAIAVLTIVCTFVSAAIFGPIMPLAVAAAGLNDIFAINRRHKDEAPFEGPEAIEVSAVEVNDSETIPADSSSSVEADALPPGVGEPLPPFDREKIISASKGLMIIGDQGAAKTSVAQYMVNGFENYGVIVFDPHAMTNWGNVYVISDMGAIFEQMKILLEQLEERDLSRLVVVCDEWLEIRGDRRNKSGGDYPFLADDFIRIFSTKPRKFNKQGIFCLHSPNCEAAGVDKHLRVNYRRIYLGEIAREVFNLADHYAYCCTVEKQQVEHPTHGHHAVYAPNGKAPRGLKPIQSAPITIPLAFVEGRSVKIAPGGWSDGKLNHSIEAVKNRLNRLLESGTDTRNSGENFSRPAQSGTDTSAGTDTGIDTSDDTGTDTSDDTSRSNTGSMGGSDDTSAGTDTGTDTSDDTSAAKLYTPAKLTPDQMKILIRGMQGYSSQTQIIQALWRCEKNKQGWKLAYSEFKELMGE